VSPITIFPLFTDAEWGSRGDSLKLGCFELKIPFLKFCVSENILREMVKKENDLKFWYNIW
jgi:hypothetical protein